MSVVNWQSDSFDVYIGRYVPTSEGGPSNIDGSSCIYGNPFVLKDINDDKERAEVIAAYEKWLMDPDQAGLVAKARTDLPGKVLACWCKPKDCHGDVLMWAVNSREDELRAKRIALGLI
jgi:hypothetical protein